MSGFLLDTDVWLCHVGGVERLALAARSLIEGSAWSRRIGGFSIALR